MGPQVKLRISATQPIPIDGTEVLLFKEDLTEIAIARLKHTYYQGEWQGSTWLNNTGHKIDRPDPEYWVFWTPYPSANLTTQRRAQTTELQ
jgi:hypothetical protein